MLVEAYGTTADFLFGLSDDPDRDPVAGMQRLLTAEVQAQLERLCSAIAQQTVASSARDSGEVLSLCRLIIGAARALEDARKLDGGWFDESVRGGAAVVAKVHAAAEAAQAEVEKINRARRATGTAHGLAYAALKRAEGAAHDARPVLADGGQP